jgi:hypothetical protein
MPRRPARRALAGLALPVILLVACASPAAPTPLPSAPPPSPSGQPTPIPSGPAGSPSPVPSTPGSSGDPSPIPSPTPKPSDAPEAPEGGFLTPSPTGFGTTWQSITWQQLDPADPFVRIRQMLRWRGGYVAVAEADVDNATTSHSPVFISEDGIAWRPLPADALGEHELIVRVVESRDGLVALTLTGGPRDCEGPEGIACFQPRLPLLAYTSSDGETWAPHPVTGLDLQPDSDEGFVDPPFVAARDGVVVVGGRAADGYRVVTSVDGRSWLPGSIPSAFSMVALAAFDNGFVAIGPFHRADGDPRAVSYFSTDGRVWTRTSLPVPSGFPAGMVGVDQLVAGPSGLIAMGGTFETPGKSLWWGSADGTTWSLLDDYPPLGTWHGDGEGTGLIPNGTLVSDGDRFIAYGGDGDVRAWTSTDGATWSPLQVVGKTPETSSDPRYPWLVVLPVGLMIVGGDHDAGIGVPSA